MELPLLGKVHGKSTSIQGLRHGRLELFVSSTSSSSVTLRSSPMEGHRPSSETLAMRFGARARAVRRAPSLPLGSVDHGRAARRHSPSGSGLVPVQSSERHLLQLDDARHVVHS